MRHIHLKKLLLPALAAMILSSCVQVGAEGASSDAVVLAPVAAAVTKGAVDGTAFPAGRTLKVAAYYNSDRGNSGTYFTNTTFARSSSTWVGGTPAAPNPKYWPKNGTLDILAYSADGLVPARLDYVPAYRAKVSEGVTLAVDDNSAVQCDILWGAAAAQSRIPSGNPLLMRHACALVAFTAWSTVPYDAARNRGVTVTSITLDGAFYAGTLVVDATAPTGGSCTWSGLSAQHDVALPSLAGALALPYRVPATPVSVADDGCHMGLGGAGILVPEQGQTSFTVRYTLHNGFKADGTTPLDNDLSYTFHCDGDAMWEEGLKYVYEICFNLREITVTPSVYDWTTNAVVTPVP